MTLVNQWQWWGRVDGVLHRFEGLSMGEDSAAIRTSPTATCGWVAPADVLEGFEIPDQPLERLCPLCALRCLCCDEYPEQCQANQPPAWGRQ